VRAGFGTDTRTVLGRLAHWAEGPAPIGPLTPPSLLATEPPDHTRMRKLVTRVFSVKAVRELRARAERVADELLDGLSADGNVDLVDRYCAALPVTMICEILGVPASEQDRVRDLGTRAAPSLDVGLPYRRFREVDSSLHEFEAWLRTHIERVRRDPGPDLLSQLVAVRDDDGAQLTDSELISTAGLVLAAGFETTVNLIGNAIALLDTHRDQRDLLQEGTASWTVAVDEVLRYDPPVFLTGRTATRDTVIAGTPIPKGTLITALLAAANRDPEIFEEPHRFDVTRHNAAEHVAFSAGRHYCLGAALARMEGEVALHKLHERYPDLRVVPGARRRDTRVLRGYAYLPARLK
jgi:cytochrome P450